MRFVKNINGEVWRYLDNHLTIKKNLSEELINVRALAKKILKDVPVKGSLNAIISAIRRYHLEQKEKDVLPQIYSLLRKSKLQTRTKLAALLLRKNSSVRERLAKLYAKIDFEGGDTFRIFEVNKYIKIILDEKVMEESRKLFNEMEIVDVEKGLGELTIIYGIDITKTPGVFALIANELAASNISIIDSMICHSEHLIILKEGDLQKGFNVVFGLTAGKNI